MSFPYRLGEGAARARIGVVVLRVDETVESDLRRLFPAPEVALFVSRIESGDDLTPGTIAAMEARLTASAALLPGVALDALGYACTSGATLIGAARVAERLRAGARAGVVTDPLSAALAAFEALGARRIGFVSPYIASVSEPMAAAFAAGGVEVVSRVAFGERAEARVARIDPASTAEAARAVAAGAEAVFLSCTNLPTWEVIGPLEAELGVPVVSSNLALAWALARAAGAPVASGAPGRLLAGLRREPDPEPRLG